MADTQELTNDEKFAMLFAQLQTLQKENVSMKEMLANVPAAAEKPAEIPKIPDEKFTVRGSEYKFIVPHFNYKGETVSAIDALTDPDILSTLVYVKSGVIVEVL